MGLSANIRAFLDRHLSDRSQRREWPFHAGKHHVIDPTAPVVVVTWNDESRARELADREIGGLCMISTLCRNAAELERFVANVASNLSIQFLLLTGENGERPPAIEALLAIFENADNVSDDAAALARSARARLQSIDMRELAKRVKLIGLRGAAEPDAIAAKVEELVSGANRPNTGFLAPRGTGEGAVERIIAAPSTGDDIRPDKAGAYVIGIEGRSLIVEHYNSKRELLRVIEGSTAQDIYTTLIRNGWVSKLDHAAYLGRELTRAESALRDGESYTQDLDSVPR